MYGEGVYMPHAPRIPHSYNDAQALRKLYITTGRFRFSQKTKILYSFQLEFRMCYDTQRFESKNAHVRFSDLKNVFAKFVNLHYNKNSMELMHLIFETGVTAAILSLITNNVRNSIDAATYLSRLKWMMSHIRLCFKGISWNNRLVSGYDMM
ncbi:hypothetical protein X798_05625 [Onchocerca flexuosa]|uniref:Uncharacterized protein n=1 Tax=Onchocerca flexuosa TaxID=387005 RepID=A0A238BPU3_9BILA|nr:hypothetical protein X798_05625 [Onchocerca flexuosa]